MPLTTGDFLRKKPLAGRNYGSIPHLIGSSLGKHDRYIHEGQDAIIRAGGRDKRDEIIVSLKLDGTNVGVMKKDGQLIAVQRKGYACSTSPYQMHHRFDGWMYRNYEKLDAMIGEGERLVGEWLWQASGIVYTISGDPFYAFDFFRADGSRRSFCETVGACSRVGIKTPPYVAFGLSSRSKNIFPDLSSCFIVPETEHEGYVYRVERGGVFDFAAKWVRSDFLPGKYLPGTQGNENGKLIKNHIIACS